MEGLTFAGEALDVEMLALHTQHLTLAWFPAFVTLDDQFLWGPVGFLRMGHCGREQRDIFSNRP